MSDAPWRSELSFTERLDAIMKMLVSECLHVYLLSNSQLHDLFYVDFIVRKPASLLSPILTRLKCQTRLEKLKKDYLPTRGQKCVLIILV